MNESWFIELFSTKAFYSGFLAPLDLIIRLKSWLLSTDRMIVTDFSAMRNLSGLIYFYNKVWLAVMIAVPYTSSGEHPRDKSLTGLFNPAKIGPTASNPPKR